MSSRTLKAAASESCHNPNPFDPSRLTSFASLLHRSTGLYFGGSSSEINLGMGPGPIVGFKMRPGSASSPDGVNWSRLNSGLPILDVGDPPEFDSQVRTSR